jgi:hypothetical protein
MEKTRFLIHYLFLLCTISFGAAAIPAQPKSSFCDKITNIPMNASDLLYYRIREVEVGKFYRSAQLPNHKLKECIEKFKIKTIINLRTMPQGKNPQWWTDEQSVAQQHKVTLVNIPMHTEVLPPKKTIETLLGIYENKENFPILVHCAHGIHRTGLAAFLYLASIGNQNALQQLSFKYFYASLWGSEAFESFCKIWTEGGRILANYHPENYSKFDPALYSTVDKSD